VQGVVLVGVVLELIVSLITYSFLSGACVALE
jgi:hypothetical protein